MASAEGGSVPSGVGYGDEVCPLSPTRRSGGASWAPPAGENGFWHILKATERSFLYLYDKNQRGTICISVPLLQILGGLVPHIPRDLCPWFPLSCSQDIWSSRWIPSSLCNYGCPYYASLRLYCVDYFCRFCSSSCSRWKRRISWTRRSSSTTSRYFVNVTRRTPSRNRNRSEK